jgi:hypothetical protein
MAKSRKVSINRAPVLTLWATVVARRLGHDQAAALTLGKALAGLNAQSKGRSLGIFGPPKATDERGSPRKAKLGEDDWIELCGRSIPVKHTDEGVRAVVEDRAISPADVERYLQSKFGPDLAAAQQAMEQLAAAFDKDQLDQSAYDLYTAFRPKIERGRGGWGQKGELDLDLIASLAKTR